MHVLQRAGSVEVDHPYYAPGCPGEQFDDNLDLNFTTLPNQPFPVSIVVEAGLFGASVDLRGANQFVLPDGYSIMSCQGYDPGTVAVAPVTWTQAKRLFE